MGINFITIFLLKARVLNLTSSKRKTLRLPLKVETDQFVFCLALPESISVKICCISPLDSESPFPLFFSLSASFKNSSPRSENCLRFGTGGPSLCLYPLLSRNIIFCPSLTMAARAKKILPKRFAHAISVSVHYRDFEHAYVNWIWLRGSASYVIKTIRTLGINL